VRGRGRRRVRDIRVNVRLLWPPSAALPYGASALGGVFGCACACGGAWGFCRECVRVAWYGVLRGDGSILQSDWVYSRRIVSGADWLFQSVFVPVKSPHPFVFTR
jgi:hypothetical protein